MSMYSGSISYERGGHMVSNTNHDVHSGFHGATSGHGHYDEPIVDVLRNSRAQLADALGHSGSKV